MGVCEKGVEWAGSTEYKAGPQKDSSCPMERSPLGVEARDEPLSMLSEPELWCCCSEPALDVMVDEDVDEERLFSLKSVMITVTLPTVMASCCAVLRSTFFSLGLRERIREKRSTASAGVPAHQFHVDKRERAFSLAHIRRRCPQSMYSGQLDL